MLENEVGKMDELHLRAQNWAIKLLYKVIRIYMYSQLQTF